MGKKALSEPLFRLVMRHEVDVLMLAECSLEPSDVLLLLNREGTSYHFPETKFSLRERVRILVVVKRGEIG